MQIKTISSLIVTLFNVGRFPIAPGTIGSIFSFLLLFLCINYIPYIFFLIIFIIIIIISIYFINIYNKDSINKDSSEIVIDEFLGCYFIFIFLPIFKNENIYLFLILSFILFRFFDILKPYPINLIDRKFKNSYGIILDDILAGLYTVIILKINYEYFL